MLTVPILNGISASGSDFTTEFPVNLIPVPKTTGVSQGYLRPAEGIEGIVDGGAPSRGGYRWRNKHYRVMGTRLLRIDPDNTVVAIGTILGDDAVTFTESFDYMAINAGGLLYLYDETTLAVVTDSDLGVSLDVEWINGYFISTDGESLVSTDIGDPFSVNPLRYASSEISPDPIVGLQKIRNELYALNRYTVEIFAAVAEPGLLFPFARIEGAQIMKGVVGSRACTEFAQSLAFVGGGTNEPPSVWIAAPGSAARIATREIDRTLQSYNEIELRLIVMESRVDRGHEFLYIHLPDQTLVYDGNASATMQQPVWFVLQSGLGQGYRARGFVWCYNQWNVADPFGTMVGKLVYDTAHHYGEVTAWRITTPVIYNEAKGGVVYDVELVSITGQVALADDPLIGLQHSTDGVQWSQPSYIKAGRRGERNKRLVWRRQGFFRRMRMQRITGDSRANISPTALILNIEGLQA